MSAGSHAIETEPTTITARCARWPSVVDMMHRAMACATSQEDSGAGHAFAVRNPSYGAPHDVESLASE